MAILTKDEILKQEDAKTMTIEVPEWGGEVIISTMSGFARDRFETSVMGKNGGANLVNIRAKLVAASLIDEEGNMLFTEADVVKLGKKSCTALDRIFDAAQKLNHLGEKELDDLAKK